MAATNNKLLKKFQEEKIKISNNLQKLKILKFDRVGKNQLFSVLTNEIYPGKKFLTINFPYFSILKIVLNSNFQAGSINTLIKKIFKFLIFTGTTDFTIKSHLRGPL